MPGWVFVPTHVEKALAERLNLEWSTGMQDWEVQVADPSLIPKVLRILAENRLTDDERHCLMNLLLASFDDLLDEDSEAVCRPGVARNWKMMLSELSRVPALYGGIIAYWREPPFEVAKGLSDFMNSLRPN